VNRPSARAAPVHVENHLLRRTVIVNPVDPMARQIGKGGEVLVGGRNSVSNRPMTGRRATPLNGLAANDPAHRRIVTSVPAHNNVMPGSSPGMT
jgi:hypothetical protein